MVAGGFERPAICLITSGTATDLNFADISGEILDLVRVAVGENVSLVQIREKHLSARALFELTRSASEITRRSETCLLVNDRVDIAVAAGADGVHLTANSVPARAVREMFGPGFVIGVSTHTHEEVQLAALEGADFVVFGPVFATPGKGEPHGLAELSALCEKVAPFPVIGIGGIDASNCLLVLGSGAAGIAAIRAMGDAASMSKLVRLARS